MAMGIFAAVLGVLIAAACISVPQLVRSRSARRPDDDDTRAYLKSTGRSARDIAEGNAALREQEQEQEAGHTRQGPDSG
jgi:hypothetical protein